MVMGVIQTVSPEPVIRAVKMADLSEHAALHRRMWKLEVEDLQMVLAWIQNCAAAEVIHDSCGKTTWQDWTAGFS